MKLNKVEKQEKSIVELEIAVSKEEFDAAIEKAYRKNVGKLNVPGFRKGKAPRRMVEQLYGRGIFFEDAINLSYPDAYDSAVEESKLDVVGRAEIDIKEIDENGNGYVFTAKVPIKPEVKLSQYKGLSAEKREVTVSDEDINMELEQLQKRAATSETKDRAVQSGDTAVIDFEGFIDGVPFEGGKGESHPLVIGEGQFIPGFENQLIGAMPNSEVDVKVTFPEEYHAKELAGKEAVFKCKVQEVKETILPALDDEFAKDVSEFDTLDALEEDLKKKLLESREKSVSGDFEEKIIDQIIEGMEAEIPEAMYERQLDQIIEDYAYKLQMQGMQLDAYLKMNQLNMDSFRIIFKPQAERQVKTMLALQKISELEGITVADEDLEQEYKNVAEKYNMEVSKVKEFLSASTLKNELLINRTVDLIRDSAVPVKPSEDEKSDSAEKSGDDKKAAPKKSTAAKKPAAEKKTTKKDADRE